MVMERCLALFENSIKSKHSLKTYRYNLDRFLKFTEIKDYESLANLDSETVQRYMEDYIMMLRQTGISRSTMRSYLSPVELFFELNKKVIYKRILHKMIPAKEKAFNDLPFTSQDIQKILLATASKRDRALVHFYASTGARPKAIDDPVLTFENVHDMPHGCKALLLYAGSNEEYWAFLTPEGSAALQEYVDERVRKGEDLTPQSPVFANKIRVRGQKGVPMTWISAHLKMYQLIRRSGIKRTKKGNRYDKAMIYGFRKRFNTILKINNEVNSNIAEKLMAHKNGLDGTYLKPTREECFNEFKKAISDLTISGEERLRLEKLHLENKLQARQDQNESVEMLRREFEASQALVIAMARVMKGMGITLTKGNGSSFANEKMTDEYEEIYNTGRNLFK